MDFVSTISSVIFYHTWDPVRCHSGYLISYKRNINKLVTKFDELDALRKDVQREVDATILERLEDVKDVVQTWLMKVDRMEKEVKGIKEKASVISNKHFLHIGLHYKLGKEAVNHIKTTDALLEDRNKFGRVSHKRPPPSTTDSLLYNEDFVIFDSRKSCVKKILEALKNEAVHSIGLCGMAGVGKMMLVKDIAKQAKDQRLFGEVVMVTVSQSIDLKRIQTVMAESLGLHLSEVSEEVRAVKLAERLATTQNKILVILDDLWETLDLSKVGIQLSEMAATCKVVITTRNKDICEIMSCEEIVELEMLSYDESWRLFASRAGDAVKSPTMTKLAQNIVKECAGLPLALVVLGTALKGKKLEIWKTVLMQLKRSMDVGLQGVSKQVFQSIKLSFDLLESEEAKSCFLHCCLYTEDYDIPKEELMHLMVGGGILIDDETLNDAQGRVDLLLNQLKARGLLLQGSSKSCVRMHNVVRDAVIQISVMADHAFYMRNYRRLSLMRNDIEDLRPDLMEYPKLEMLILRGNEMLSSISKMFFLHMGSLMVLDLSSTCIKSLPKSVSCLTNIRVLNLGFCDCLEDISHINGLKRLEILILDGCPVSIVPPKGRSMQKLECLDIDDCPMVLELFPCDQGAHNITELLPGLRTLFLRGLQSLQNVLQPFQCLPNLKNLLINDCGDLPQLTVFHNPTAPLVERLHLTSYEIEGFPKLQEPLEGLQRLQNVLQPLQCLQSLQSLYLIGLQRLKNVLQPFILLPNLKKLSICDCGVRYVVSFEIETVAILADPFPALEDLDIRQCQEMSEMISPPASLQAPCFFQRLRELRIQYCPRLKYLFTYEQAIDMQHLEGLYIGYCDVLQALHIVSCPKLTCLFLLKQAGGMQQLEEIHVEDCAALERIVVSDEKEEDDDDDRLPQLTKPINPDIIVYAQRSWMGIILLHQLQYLRNIIKALVFIQAGEPVGESGEVGLDVLTEHFIED
ncbi:P-loop containing nucleoside triphosphate hydrolase protein [Dioscorea alata]|uniref:P-loop containing nucleoside triphosphate hydrolase protein n=1 Tax=Dioscorea alata TaxID=55571 RepID=A0ACB7ULJ8_DIOAL|nr:P-loop containing nucleoside triphosphate hydrolase protein [Dioscorea alata]